MVLVIPSILSRLPHNTDFCFIIFAINIVKSNSLVKQSDYTDIIQTFVPSRHFGTKP